MSIKPVQLHRLDHAHLYLVTSDQSLCSSEIQTVYQKRWKIEVYHKSLKSNASFPKSPARTVRTQSNHFLLASGLMQSWNR